MISLLAANDNAASAAAAAALAAAQLGAAANFYGVGNGIGQPLGLGSVIRPNATTSFGDFSGDQQQRNLRAAAAAAFASSQAASAMMDGESTMNGGGGGLTIEDVDENSSRLKYKTTSMDDMDEDDYLSIPGDEKFAAFRQMAISGKMANKVCRVCGDRALGYNFNVVSCESCKAFFRRNALKKKDFRCPFNDNCDVTALSRRFCQKCRLRKCFEVGMKKEWIMSEEQRIQKRKRIEENRQKRRTASDKDGGKYDDEISTDDPPPSVKNNIIIQQNMTNAGFSPGSNPGTPVATALGNDFSPPDSNGPSLADQRRNNLDGQTFLSPSTVLKSPSVVSKKDSVPDGFCAITKLESPQLGSCLDLHQNLQPRGGVISNSDDCNMPLLAASSQLMNLGFAGVAATGQHPHTLAGIVDESMITIPKAVLINLINQCHQKQRESFDFTNLDQPTPPPVVIRAHRLYTDDGERSDHDVYKCICRCTCGAKAAGSCIGPRVVDRAVGPECGGICDEFDDDDCNDRLEATPDYQQQHETTAVQLRVPSESSSVVRASSTELADAAAARSPSTRRTDVCYGLTILEELKLRELLIANQVMTEDLDSSEMLPPKNGAAAAVSNSPEAAAACSLSPDDPIIGQANASGEPTCQIDPTDVIHMTDICVRRIIKMCKRLGAFKSLCQDDQIALLKGGCTELMILRGVMTFIPAKECWRPVGWKNSLLSLDVMKGVKGNVYEEHRKYLHSFREEWRSCDAVMLCLAAITLFNPERPNIVHVEAVQEEQALYIDLLKRYLEIMYGLHGTASDEAFQELLGRVTAVGRLNDYAATIFVDVNPRDVEPLLIEIFDLK